MAKLDFPEAIKISGTGDNKSLFFVLENRTREGVQRQLMVAKPSGIEEIEDVSKVPEQLLPLYTRLINSYICLNKCVAKTAVM